MSTDPRALKASTVAVVELVEALRRDGRGFADAAVEELLELDMLEVAAGAFAVCAALAERDLPFWESFVRAVRVEAAFI